MYQILLIDDSAADNFMHARTLARQFPGCTVHCATDGAMGLARLAEDGAGAIDLILLDIHMPVLDAWGFLAGYGELPASARAQRLLLMVSVALPAEDEARVRASEFVTATVTKPLDGERVAAAMEACDA